MARDSRFEGEAVANVRVDDDRGDGCEDALYSSCACMLTCTKILSSTFFLFIDCIGSILSPTAFMACVSYEMYWSDCDME